MLITATKFTTLFLLGEPRPYEFLFEDTLQKQYTVCIGSQVCCTCNKAKGHCLHSLYVMMKVFGINEKDPLLFKQNYSEAEMQRMRKHFNQQKSKQKLCLDQQVQSLSLSSININKVLPNHQTISSSNQNIQPPMDSVCCICYDQINNEAPLIDCYKCHNYLHTKCLSVWIDKKRQNNQNNGTCPMCRTQLVDNIKKRIQRLEALYVQQHYSFGIHCSSCANNIMMKLYKCLLCQNVFLCQQCYKKWEHKNHSQFICKQSKNSPWTVSQRSDFKIERLHANLEYSKQLQAKGEEIKELIGPKYEQFLSSFIKKKTLLSYLIDSFLDVQKQIHKTYKKIDFEQKDIVCCLCKNKKIVGMKRIDCKHFMDLKCLKFCLQNGLLKCPLDQKYFLPGIEGVDLKLK